MDICHSFVWIVDELASCVLDAIFVMFLLIVVMFLSGEGIVVVLSLVGRLSLILGMGMKKGSNNVDHGKPDSLWDEHHLLSYLKFEVFIE